MQHLLVVGGHQIGAVLGAGEKRVRHLGMSCSIGYRLCSAVDICCDGHTSQDIMVEVGDIAEIERCRIGARWRGDGSKTPDVHNQTVRARPAVGIPGFVKAHHEVQVEIGVYEIESAVGVPCNDECSMHPVFETL